MASFTRREELDNLTIGQLKELLEGVPDDTEIWAWTNEGMLNNVEMEVQYFAESDKFDVGIEIDICATWY